MRTPPGGLARALVAAQARGGAREGCRDGSTAGRGRSSRARRNAGDKPRPAPRRRRALATTSLPPVESLTIDSDFTAFLQPKVDETLKRQALKQLFRDPRFNVMDGLDVYIDDYSKPDPIAPEVVRQLVQAPLHLRSAGDARERAGRRRGRARRRAGAPRADASEHRATPSPVARRRRPGVPAPDDAAAIRSAIRRAASAAGPCRAMPLDRAAPR